MDVLNLFVKDTVRSFNADKLNFLFIALAYVKKKSFD